MNVIDSILNFFKKLKNKIFTKRITTYDRISISKIPEELDTSILIKDYGGLEGRFSKEVGKRSVDVYRQDTKYEFQKYDTL